MISVSNKYRKIIFYIIYFLVFVIVFALGYRWFDYARLKAAAPKYELAEELKNLNNKTGNTANVKPKEQLSKDKIQGFVAIDFINNTFGKPIYDSIAVNTSNAYLAFASDNNPDYQYKSYDVSGTVAVFLSSRRNDDINGAGSHVFKGVVRGVKLPNRFGKSQDLGSLSEISKDILSLSPDKKNLLLSSTHNGAIYLYSLYNREFKKLQNGSFARWVDSDNFVYIEGQSLKIYNVKTSTTRVLWDSISGNVVWLDSSKGKNILAISIPDIERVSVVKIVKQGSLFTLEQLGSIKARAGSLALSPDAKYIVLMTGEPNSWNLRVYSLDSFSSMDSLIENSQIFEFYKSDFARISDWY